MGRTRLLIERYGALGLLLLAMSAVTATIVASCGSGGGDSSSTGALCEQCGASDGACQQSAWLFPRDPQQGAIDAVPCPTPSSGTDGCVNLPLICRRKSDSAQQRCYPQSTADPSNPDFFFRCDGSRPGGTARPEPTQTATPIPAATATPACGNGLAEGNEQCDFPDLRGQTCSSLGCVNGVLSCNSDCTFNTLACTVQNCP